MKKKISKRRIRIGIVGCGAIGSKIAIACQERFRESVELVGLCDVDIEKTRFITGELKRPAKTMDLKELIERSDLVVEAASTKVSRDIVKMCLRSRKDVMVMSVGGLLDFDDIFEKARRAGSKVYLPSGAICGVDGVKAASFGKIRRIVLTTRKPPRSLKGAPRILKEKIDLDKIDKETLIFDGTVKEAVRAFPKNINVSATLRFASLDEKKVKVRIMTSPAYTRNIHEIEVESDSGGFFIRTVNLPSEDNPKTSKLAIRSAIATLGGILGNVKVGT